MPKSDSMAKGGKTGRSAKAVSRESRRILGFVIVLVLLGAGAYTLVKQGTFSGEDRQKLAPSVVFPEYVYTDKRTLETYTIATQIPEVLEKIPCYCSCGDIGHKSVKNCFVNEYGDFDSHGANCDLCMREVLDVDMWYKQGVPLREIRSRIDEKYGRDYGRGTDTPLFQDVI